MPIIKPTNKKPDRLKAFAGQLSEHESEIKELQENAGSGSGGNVVIDDTNPNALNKVYSAKKTQDELNTKSGTTYVDAQLLTVNNAITQLINDKANIAYVDTKVASIINDADTTSTTSTLSASAINAAIAAAIAKK